MRKSLAASKIYDWASFFLFSIIILISFFIFSDYSSCWDQFFHVEYGKAILNWYNSSFADKHAITGEGIAYNIRYYGGIFDVISTAFSRLVPFINDYTARRFMILLTGLSGLFFCWRLGRLLYGPKLGLFCLISIVTIPMYFGHMFFNPKDMPFAAAYICSLYFIIKILLDLPLLKKKNIVWLSCAIGFAAGVRISGFVIVMYLGLALILYKIFAGKYLSIPGNKKISIYSIIGILVFVSIVSFAIAMVCWPYLLTDPLRVFNVSKYIANFNGLKNEYVFGYLLSRFNSQLPELHTVLIYLGLMIGSLKVYSLYKNRSSLSPNVLSRAIGIFILVLSILFPLTIVVIKSTPLYNELRQVLFIMPPLSCLLAITFSVLVSEEKYIKYVIAVFFSIVLVMAFNITQFFIISFVVAVLLIYYFSRIFTKIDVKYVKKIIFVLTIALLCQSLIVMYELHPYEYTYFNKFAGGTQGALSKGYDTSDYWLISYKETLDKFHAYLNKKFPNMRAIRIGVCTMPPNVKPYLGENLILETDPDKMDFFIFTEKAYACHPYDYFRNAPLVVETKRSNIRLGGVLDVRRSKDRLLPKKYINRNYNVDLRIRTLITNNPNLDYDVSTWTILDKRLLIPMVDFTLSDALYSEKLGFFPIIYHNSFMLDMNTALSVNRAGSYKISISADNGARVTLDGKVISEIQVKEQFDRARRLYETKEVEVYLAKGNHHLNIIYSHIPEALVKIIAKYKRTDQNKYFMIGEDSKDVKFIPYSRVLKESRNFSYN